MIVICMISGTATAAFDIYSDISRAIENSNSAAVAKYFGKTVEMTIVDNERVYSKTQAEQVLRDFLMKNKPESFRIIHKGTSKEGATYAIGKLITTTEREFRVYFFVKNTSAGEYIQELRFEKE